MSWLNPFSWRWPANALGGSPVPYVSPDLTIRGEGINPADYPRGLEPGFMPLELSSMLDKHTFNTSGSYFEAVEACTPLAAIIGRKAEAFANGIVEVLKRDSKTNTKEPYVRGQYREWERLLAKPNPLQSRTTFIKQLYTFTSIRGWCYVIPVYPAGFTDRPSSLWILPPWYCEVVGDYSITYDQLISGKPPRRVYFSYGGRRQLLDESKLLLFTDNTTAIDPTTWLPISRLEAAQMPISNIIAGMDARNNLMVRRGAIGFISAEKSSDGFGAVATTADEKDEMRREYQRAHGITGNRDMIAITQASMKWNAMTFPTKDLMLHEEHKGCVSDLCDVEGYPAYLLGITGNGTYANVGEAKKSLYQDTIIPEATAFLEQLNEGLKTPASNIEIVISYDHIEALQQSEKDKAEARRLLNQALIEEWEAGRITLNYWGEQIGDDPNAGEQFSLYKPQYDKWLQDNGLAPQLPITGSDKTDLTALEKENQNKPAANGNANTPAA